MLRSTLRFLAMAPKVTHIQDKLLINGKFVPAVSGKTFEVVNPADETVIANVAEADKADVDIAVKAARAAFETYRMSECHWRRNTMLRLADILEKNSTEMAALESLDNGKPYDVALNSDVALAVDCFRYYAGFADKVDGYVPPRGGNFLAVVKRQPIGVCGQIIPWNFPLLMAAWKVAPALACGNTVVLKPAEQTPLSALRLGEMTLEAGYPAGVVNILPGFGATAGAAIASHMDVNKVAFTGSTMIGREVMRLAAESNIKKVSLELGGKSALIVCEDADVEQAAQVATMGIYFNVGQVCTASSRMYVHESVYDEFVSRLRKHAESRKIGAGNNTDNNMGPLVSKKQHERVLSYIEAGVQEGATVVTGGGKVGDKGYYVQPTIFADVKEDMKICKEEIFGPVTCVMKFKDMDEVVKRANDSIYGLAAGICTRKMDTAIRYASYLDAGTVWVNSWNNFDASVPFGGFKQSGIGRELGRGAIDLYTETKGIHFALEGPIVKP
ncbi:putative mitochondrial aldehyde dehydrogenase, mitochondrial precursor (ALDH2) [Leptomonas pyrrhocoris]|uniref:Putative mitochondrial aldehyde dehydrogenase, mitochondrial (ALDH2) n=1 Tax=Leptomonas pyrrhocoris TaxID=157538 RepID=A0A0N0DUW9_LEPPY|nr:putative mitochondrial aldehyde dehydrogenase, mitochondrial precursor (ALDH2) [Leptomonas pyrrhocoris]XP_015658002.1 putative mitochondrial aldehyde dehydrogenase, mitochondrial precursor (ALDH2) [Leptomonas pyrrhocoris]KPA79562.1 putative mitochondrial aldehyde dehydrogenase, mitochondrial precursor (ALDH2) [Leptomonas pyrrhocoris]KPA79563.1 putative mitochondrial aldehyde dehydrogenase, mitochondrial precursor (ALDH2) [Leptomonas pyrrhocoris]|eukprot:XP_015658001.1 putative mitochondrial aldehyde dehydrogenase, mitochondrial precursor (ALDH2) [Leptomonas pyrrhocoris]